jgi:hypothetical protein
MGESSECVQAEGVFVGNVCHCWLVQQYMDVWAVLSWQAASRPLSVPSAIISPKRSAPTPIDFLQKIPNRLPNCHKTENAGQRPDDATPRITVS